VGEEEIVNLGWGRVDANFCVLLSWRLLDVQGFIGDNRVKPVMRIVVGGVELPLPRRLAVNFEQTPKSLQVKLS
jgi:hypothetical protein